MYDIIVGRSESDKKKLGKEGTILLGKHYVKMGRTTSLSNSIYLDVTTSHVVFVCGKRGSGKSFSLGVIAEGMADLEPHIAKNLSIIILDTMGIYWTMKYPNHHEKELLQNWGLDAKGLNVTIYTPEGFYNEYREKGIPTDFPFSIKASELLSTDWCMTFDIAITDPIGILIEKIIAELQDANDDFTLDDIIVKLQEEKKEQKKIGATNSLHIIDAAINMFSNAKTWGLFSKKGTPLTHLAKAGQVTVLDVSCYATKARGWEIKSLAIGLIAQKLFNKRMQERKDEEYKEVKKEVEFIDETKEQKYPLVWLVLDEAHEFLPAQGKTTATDALVTLLREGRQPGISLILATQQPGKIHTDVLTQADTILAHRITAKLDTDALGLLMQSYMRQGLDKELDNLPRVKGAALILDDANEKMYPMRVRPRFTWHGGSSPTALHEDKKWF